MSMSDSAAIVRVTAVLTATPLNVSEQPRTNREHICSILPTQRTLVNGTERMAGGSTPPISTRPCQNSSGLGVAMFLVDPNFDPNPPTWAVLENGAARPHTGVVSVIVMGVGLNSMKLGLEQAILQHRRQIWYHISAHTALLCAELCADGQAQVSSL